MVKEDVMNAFTLWRQNQTPVMQLVEYEAAQLDMTRAFPPDSYRSEMVADADALQHDKTGKLVYHECWSGFQLLPLPNELQKQLNDTKAEPVFSPDEPENCTEIHWDTEGTGPDVSALQVQMETFRQEVCSKLDDIRTLLESRC